MEINENQIEQQGEIKKVNKKTTAIIGIAIGIVVLIIMLLCLLFLLPKPGGEENAHCEEIELNYPDYGELSTLEYEDGIFRYRIYSDGIHCSVTGLVDEMSKFKLKEINIPNKIDGYTVVTIGIRAFSGCQEIENLTFPSTLTAIGPEAFSNCFSLKGIHIPDSVAVIDYSAFSSCVSIVDVNIPENLVKLGAGAFENCPSIIGTDYGNAKYLGKGDNPYFALIYVFPHATSFTVHKSTELVTNGTGLTIKEIKVEEGNNRYSAIEGNLYSKCGKTLVFYANGKDDTSFTLPNGVEKIEGFALRNSKQLTSVIIPHGVTVIGEYAFTGCQRLTEVTLSAELIKIKEYAFYNCLSLTDVYFKGSIEQWHAVNVEIGNYSLNNVIMHYNTEL